jgi:uncharacterized Zn finger protein (UPF0148 family)
MNPDGAKRCVKCNQELSEPIPEPVVVEEQVIEQPQVIARPQSDTRATVVLQHSPEVNQQNDMPVCCACGYPLAAGATECPNCGSQVKSAASMVQPMVESQPAVQPTPMNRTIMDVGMHPSAPSSSKPDMMRTVMDVGVVRDSNKHAAMKQTVRDFSILENLDKDEPQETVAAKSCAHLEPMDNFDGKSTSIALNSDNVLLNRANVDATNLSIDVNEQARMVCRNGEWFIQNLSQTRTTYVCTSREIKLEVGDIVVVGNKRYIFQ